MQRTRKSREKKTTIALTLATVFAIIIINTIFVKQLYGYYIFYDELGYWSHAASMSGLDWFGITKTINWYSYGYSFVLYVAIQASRLVGGDLTTAYRIAIGINALFCALVFLLCHGLAKRNDKEGGYFPILSAAVATLGCGLIFHSRTAWAECCITLLTTVVVYLALSNEKTGRQTLRNIGLSASVGAIYIVHNRMLGVVVAFFVYAALMIFVGKKRLRAAASLLLPVILILALDRPVGAYFKLKMWGAIVSPYNTNNASEMLGRMTDVFTLDGIMAVIRTTLGQLWYMGTASFGLFYLGIVHYFRRMIKLARKKDIQTTLAWGFVGLGFLLSLGISVVSRYKYYIPEYYIQSDYYGRSDVCFYGRYIENWAPVFSLFGCLELKRYWADGKKAILIAIAIGLFHFAAIFSIQRYLIGDMSGANNVCVPSVAALSHMLSSGMSMAAVSVLFYIAFFGMMIASWAANHVESLKYATVVPMLIIIGISALSSTKLVKEYVDGFQPAMKKTEYLADSKMNLRSKESGVVIGLAGEPDPLNQISVMMRRLQFMNPGWRFDSFDDGEYDKVLDTKADCYLVQANDTEGISLFADAYVGTLFAEYNAIAFTPREDGETDNIVDIPIEYFYSNNGAIENSAVYSDENGGFVLFGPYITLSKGVYRVTINGEVLEGGFNDDSFADATIGSGEKVVASCNQLKQYVDKNEFSIPLSFELEEEAMNSEFRLFINPGIRIVINRVDIALDDSTDMNEGD